MTGPFRVYTPEECGRDGYPFAWHFLAGDEGQVEQGVKGRVRTLAGGRCQRCGHPYEAGMGEWSPCDERCVHGGALAFPRGDDPPEDLTAGQIVRSGGSVLARWRILTVHHLTGVKADLRWWNLVALCQRCHLNVQRRVVMDRPWPWPHSPWFELHAAGWYALKYLGADITRDQALDDLDELLELGRGQESIERMPL